MSYMLEILGRGLVSELAAVFGAELRDDGCLSLDELQADVSDAAGEATVANYHSLAVRLLADHQFGAARAHWKQALAIDPTNRAARIGFACTLDELGLTHEAMEQINSIIEDHPDDADCWFACGFCYEKLGESDEAIRCYENALDINLNFHTANERLAAIYLKLDDLELAITHYEHLYWSDPADTSTTLALANLYIKAGRHEDAADHFQRFLVLDPDAWEVHDDFVAACVDAGRIEDAIELLQALIAKRPTCAEQHVRLGDLYRKIGRCDAAIESYQWATKLNPDLMEASIKIGTVQLRRGELEDAAAAFCRAIEINDSVIDGYIGLGVAQLALGDQAGAEVSLESATEIESNSTMLFAETARLELMVSASKQRDRYLAPAAITSNPMGPPSVETTDLVDAQLDNIQQAIASQPTHADLHYRLALLLKQQGRHNQAIAAFRKAVEINPNYSKALIKLGLTLRSQGQLEEAQQVLQQALKVSPESVELHYELGLIFADRQAFRYALEQFELANMHGVIHEANLANLALSLQDMGLLDRAAATWHTLSNLSHFSKASESLRSQS